MAAFLKFMQALGIALCGYGLVAGMIGGDIGAEYLYSILGVVIFYIAYYVDSRMMT